MPWVVPSHQALVLPLKAWRPRWVSGLGLVLGTIAPDAVFILTLDPGGSKASHSLLGQLYLTVPLVLLAHWLTTAMVLPWLLPRVGDGPPLHLHALGGARPAAGVCEWLRVAWSGAIGGLTHIFIDGFTHSRVDDGWAIGFFPWLEATMAGPWGGFPIYGVLQIGLSIGLAAAALASWSRIVSRGILGAGARRARPRRPDPLRRAFAIRAAGLALAGLVGAPILRQASDVSTAFQLAVYGALAFPALGALAGATTHRARVLWRLASRVRSGAFSSG